MKLINKILMFGFLLFFIGGMYVPVLVSAITQDDADSITKNTPFYDTCGISNGDESASGDLAILHYPTCAKDDAKFAKVIDDYISGYGSGNSPLKGKGKDFVSSGKKHDINPAWAVAVAIHETSLGTCSGCSADSNNAFGIKAHDQFNSKPGTDYAYYDTWEIGIEDFFNLVSGPLYLGNKKVKTLQDVIEIYCPKSDGCDPKAYEKAILKPINDIMKKVCGKDWDSSSDPSAPDDSGSSGKSNGEPLKGVDTITVKGKKHVIPAKKGKYGYEQHLVVLGNKGDNGDEKKHYELTGLEKGPDQNGFAGTPADGPPPPYHDGHESGALGTKDPIEEQYYIAMRWKYSGGGTGNEDSSWYLSTHPRVIVTDPKTKKQVIAAAVDWGPATSTGRVAGLSPEANRELHPAKQDDELEFAWAEDQTLEPGPVDGKSDTKIKSSKSTDTCADKSSGDGGLGVSPDGFTFPLITTQKDVNFSDHDHPYEAVDIFEKEGTVWVAAVDGKIEYATEDQCSGAGDYDVPRLQIAGKDGNFYYYTHGKEGSLKVGDGDRVKAGEPLGEIGPTQCAMSTPTHLHFQGKEKSDIGPCSRTGGCPGDKYNIDVYPWLKEAYKNLPKK